MVGRRIHGKSLHQKQVSRAGTNNHIPPYLGDVITCPWPQYLLASVTQVPICEPIVPNQYIIVNWSVREITKSSNVSTFSATNINSNIVWFLQMHDTIQMKSNYTWVIYNHDSIAIRSHITIYNLCEISFLVPNLVALISQKEKNVWFFDYHLLTCSVRKMVIICLVQNINMC